MAFALDEQRRVGCVVPRAGRPPPQDHLLSDTGPRLDGQPMNRRCDAAGEAAPPDDACAFADGARHPLERPRIKHYLVSRMRRRSV